MQTDRRIKRTQNLLAKALIALTLEKGYEAVTIRDITERADVGYATFFRHYHSKDELLHGVSEVVIEELIDLLFAAPVNNPEQFGAMIFGYVRQHSEVIRVLLASSQVVQRIIGLGTQNIMKRNAAQEEAVVPIEIAAHHLMASSVALIQWWLDHHTPYPPERMGTIYYQLIALPTSLLAFRQAEA